MGTPSIFHGVLQYSTSFLTLRGLACKWEQGPDEVCVTSDYGTNTLTNCFVNINAADFGIELDRIARISISDTTVLCDGEATADRVLNRPVGLFKVEGLQRKLAAGENRFIPDRVFYDGEEHEPERFEEYLRGPFTAGLDWRSESEVEAYKQASDVLGLCPVTRSIVLRHRRYLDVPGGNAPESANGGQYDVFISFGEPDTEVASRVYRHLISTSRPNVFFAPEALPHERRLWSEPIDAVLATASTLVAVATAPENLSRGWVKYEIRAFHQLHAAEDNSSIVPFISDFKECLLPMPVRAYQALSWRDEGSLNQALRQLSARIGNRRNSAKIGL